ncbi:MAG TPA: ABC transporter ATP-binding protein [Thermotoga sp.]|nr:ABC transporter ATP-binding protein [Thermotoga sp.]
MRIDLVNVSYSYYFGTSFEKLALRKINLSIEKGETVLILGKTGSGKSTLLQTIASLLEPQDGMVLYDGVQKKGYEIRRKIGFAFQMPEDQFFAENVYEEVAFAFRNFFPEKDPKPFVKRALNLVGMDFEAIRNRSPFTLSGGEGRRVAIASIIVHDPDVLILDEPLVMLDRKGKEMILNVLKKWKQFGKTLIIATHDLDWLLPIADRIVLIEKGEILLDNDVESFLKQDLKDFATSRSKVYAKLLRRNINPFNLSFEDLVRYICQEGRF